MLRTYTSDIDARIILLNTLERIRKKQHNFV